MIAILIVDYFLLRKRKLSLSNLYTNSDKSVYWYTHGFNFRAIGSWLIGVLPLTPG